MKHNIILSEIKAHFAAKYIARTLETKKNLRTSVFLSLVNTAKTYLMIKSTEGDHCKRCFDFVVQLIAAFRQRRIISISDDNRKILRC